MFQRLRSISRGQAGSTQPRSRGCVRRLRQERQPAFLIRGRGGDVSSRVSPPTVPFAPRCNSIPFQSLGRSPSRRDSTIQCVPTIVATPPLHIVRPSVRPSFRRFPRHPPFSSLRRGLLPVSPSDFGRRGSRDTCVKIYRSRSRPMYTTNRTIPHRRRDREGLVEEQRRSTARPCASYATTVTPDRGSCCVFGDPSAIGKFHRFTDDCVDDRRWTFFWESLKIGARSERYPFKGGERTTSRERRCIHFRNRFRILFSFFSLLYSRILSSILKRLSNASRSPISSQVRSRIDHDREYAACLAKERKGTISRFRRFRLGRLGRLARLLLTSLLSAVAVIFAPLYSRRRASFQANPVFSSFPIDNVA